MSRVAKDRTVYCNLPGLHDSKAPLGGLVARGIDAMEEEDPLLQELLSLDELPTQVNPWAWQPRQPCPVD